MWVLEQKCTGSGWSRDPQMEILRLAARCNACRRLRGCSAARGKDIREATYEAALLRLRPIMMTALVACLGLLPAALSHGIGSDTQRPFAIVIVAGLISRLFLGFFVNPVLYEVVARPGDVLQV